MSEIARANIDRGKEAQQARVMIYSGLTADAIGKAVAREMSKLPPRGGVIDENRLYQTFEERRKLGEYIEKGTDLRGDNSVLLNPLGRPLGGFFYDTTPTWPVCTSCWRK